MWIILGHPFDEGILAILALTAVKKKKKEEGRRSTVDWESLQRSQSEVSGIMRRVQVCLHSASITIKTLEGWGKAEKN